MAQPVNGAPKVEAQAPAGRPSEVQPIPSPAPGSGRPTPIPAPEQDYGDRPMLIEPGQVETIRRLMEQDRERWQGHTVLSTWDERQFMEAFRKSPWVKDFTRRFGGAPDPSDPSYDFRGAWRAGTAPLDRPGERWPMEFVSPFHPGAWVGYVKRATGRDPEGMTAQHFWEQVQPKEEAPLPETPATQAVAGPGPAGGPPRGTPLPPLPASSQPRTPTPRPPLATQIPTIPPPNPIVTPNSPMGR